MTTENPKSIAETVAALAEEMNYFDDWEDKYQYIIELAQELPPFPTDDKVEENIIQGCQSRVWLTARHAEGRVQFLADSDAVITKGLVALLVRVLSNHTPQEILTANMDFIDTLGIRSHLSPTRSNGLLSMLKQMRTYALAFSVR